MKIVDLSYEELLLTFYHNKKTSITFFVSILDFLGENFGFLGQILNFVRSKKVKILNFVRSKKVKILIFKVKMFNFLSDKMVALIIMNNRNITDTLLRTQRLGLSTYQVLMEGCTDGD